MYTTSSRVKTIIADHLYVHERECTDEAHIMDSLDKVDLMMQLEREFNRSFNDEDFEKLHTVGQIIAYIDERVAA